MSFRKACVSEKNTEKKDKVNWILKLIKKPRSSKQNTTIHCSGYSSVICLRCDKCWATSSKTFEEQKE